MRHLVPALASTLIVLSGTANAQTAPKGEADLFVAWAKENNHLDGWIFTGEAKNEWGHNLALWSRLGPSDKYKTLWARSEYDKYQSFTPSFTGKSLLTLIEFDCQTSSFRILQQDEYAENNLAGAKHEEPVVYPRWNMVEPDTAWGAFSQVACNNPTATTAPSRHK